MIEQKMPELGECADYVSISRVKRWEDGEKVPKYSIHIEGDYPDDGYKDNSVKFWNLYDWQVEFIAEQLNKADKLEKRLAEAEKHNEMLSEFLWIIDWHQEKIVANDQVVKLYATHTVLPTSLYSYMQDLLKKGEQDE